MTITQSPFDEIEALLQEQGIEATLHCLAEHLLAEKRYHELFEARKMQVRHRLSLPILYSDSSDNLDEETRDKLEAGLIDACREVGLLLLGEGQVREGWIYLRPVGDRAAANEALHKIEVNDDNLDEFVEVLLHEGVNTRRGFSLVLEHFGTCNSITTFESLMYQRPKEERQTAASLLLKHLHAELSASVKADIARQEGTKPTENTLAELVVDRPWLFSGCSYHVDTTHLSSVVRIARLLDDPDDLRLAYDLTCYGRLLDKQFQYAGDEPFRDMYPSHALYFQAQLGEHVDEALQYFAAKAETTDPLQDGTMSIEVYIDLLARIGRFNHAICATRKLIPEGVHLVGIAPSLFELSQQAGQFDALLEACRTRHDLLGFTAGAVCRQLQQS